MSIICANCLDENTELVIKNNDIINITNFEQLGHLFVGNGDEFVDLQNSGYEVLSSNGKFVKIKSIMRRNVDEDLYRLQFVNGTNVLATAEHIFTLVNGNEKCVKDMSIGDSIPVTKYPDNAFDELNEINLVTLFGPAEDIVIANWNKLKLQLSREVRSAVNKVMRKLRSVIHLKDPWISLKEYYEVRHIAQLDETKIILRCSNSEYTINPIFKLDSNLGKFLGYIASEGHVNRRGGHIIFANTDESLINDFVSIVNKLFPNVLCTVNRYEHNTSPCTFVHVYGKIITRLFDGTLMYKHHSNDICLPKWFRFANNEFIFSFLASEIDGDGSVLQNHISLISVSEQYIKDIVNICALRNIASNVSIVSKANTIAKFSDCESVRNYNAYRLCFSLTSIDTLFNGIKPFSHKASNIEEIKSGPSTRPYLCKVIGKSLEHYKGYVYDLETEDHHFSANGVISHNCLQIDLNKLFTGGFSTGHGTLREPNSIRSYAALAAIAIQANQNEQFIVKTN